METARNAGLTDSELLYKIWTELDDLNKNFHKHEVEVVAKLGERPTRQEMISWLGGAGVVSGIIFGLISTMGS